jgi:hypothetical protein
MNNMNNIHSLLYVMASQERDKPLSHFHVQGVQDRFVGFAGGPCVGKCYECSATCASYCAVTSRPPIRYEGEPWLQPILQLRAQLPGDYIVSSNGSCRQKRQLGSYLCRSWRRLRVTVVEVDPERIPKPTNHS